jgi:hypothetical protein
MNALCVRILALCGFLLWSSFRPVPVCVWFSCLVVPLGGDVDRVYSIYSRMCNTHVNLTVLTPARSCATRTVPGRGRLPLSLLLSCISHLEAVVKSPLLTTLPSAPQAFGMAHRRARRNDTFGRSQFASLGGAWDWQLSAFGRPYCEEASSRICRQG